MGQALINVVMLCLFAGGGTESGGREEKPFVPRVKVVRELAGCSESPLLCLQGLALLPEGGFLVADRLAYRIKMFGGDGKLLRTVGGRGSEPGRFLAPGPVDYSSAGIAVAEFAGSTIHLYSTALAPECRFRAAGTVSDMRCDARGGVWTVLLPEKGPAVLSKYSRSGERELTRSPRHATGNHFADACLLDLGRGGSLVITYLLRNIVEVWDTSGKWIRDLAVPGLPAMSPYRTLGGDLPPGGVAVPEGLLFRSATVDGGGRIYVLGGDFSVHPGRDIYLFDGGGRYTGFVTLPREAVMIRRGKEGQLLAIGRGRNSVTEYRLVWEGRDAR